MKRIQRRQLSRWAWIVILTLSVSGAYLSAEAQDASDSPAQQSVMFDSMFDGFATVNPTGLRAMHRLERAMTFSEQQALQGPSRKRTSIRL